jgi:glycosyltransferase involved in cell wall biosynthesis
MAGRLAPWTEPAVQELRTASGAADQIELLGHVPADRIRSLYAGALALIVTSRYESFCLPMAEAMACGTPVIAFDNSALPEISGGAARLVPDGDVAEMIRSVRRLRGSRDEQDERATAGRERSRSFDWDASAATHAEVFRAIRR